MGERVKGLKVRLGNFKSIVNVLRSKTKPFTHSPVHPLNLKYTLIGLCICFECAL